MKSSRIEGNPWGYINPQLPQVCAGVIDYSSDSPSNPRLLLPISEEFPSSPLFTDTSVFTSLNPG